MEQFEWLYVDIKTHEAVKVWLEYLVEISEGYLSQDSFTSLIFYCESGPLIDKWEMDFGYSDPAIPPHVFEKELESDTVPITIPVPRSHYEIMSKLAKRAYSRKLTAEEMITVFFSIGAKDAFTRFVRSNEALHAVNPELEMEDLRLDFEAVFPYYRMWEKIGIL